MNYHTITKADMLNGEGLRTVLWVSGCNHHCPSCHNPQTHPYNSGKLFDENAKKELFEEIEKSYNEGVTFSGGDPLYSRNRKTILDLAKEIKEKMPNKTIWCYTGFLWEDIQYLEGIENIDVLIDGRFFKKLKDTKLRWRGSLNQRIIDVKKTLEKGEVVLYEE